MSQRGQRPLDLLLINPTTGLGKVPIGLLSIAAYVRKQGFSVALLDQRTQDVEGYLRKTRGVRVIGITATTDCVSSAFKICNYIKSRVNPDILCVLGGYHATALPERCMVEGRFDIVAFGEGEDTMLEILRSNGPAPRGILGTLERTPAGIVKNDPRPLRRDLDDLPFLAYDLLDMETWFHGIRGDFGRARRSMLFMTSRGCPFECPFCSSAQRWHRRLRFFSPNRVVAELRYAMEKFGLDGAVFEDDDFAVNKRRLNELCDSLISSSVSKDLRWSCQARADSLDRETLRLLKVAGCALVRIGFESGAQSSLDFLKGGTLKVEQLWGAARLCREEGIPCFGSFIIGSPDETLNDILETIDFIENSGIDNAGIFVATPYPGTQLWAICQERGYLPEECSWSDFVVEPWNRPSLIRNSNFTAEQLTNIRNYIHLQVVEPLNRTRGRGLGPAERSLDHQRELEKVLTGDLRLTKPGSHDRLRRMASSSLANLDRARKAAYLLSKGDFRQLASKIGRYVRTARWRRVS